MCVKGTIALMKQEEKREMWVIFVIWIVLVFISYMTVNYCSFFACFFL